jgi:hypothetical protein
MLIGGVVMAAAVFSTAAAQGTAPARKVVDDMESVTGWQARDGGAVALSNEVVRDGKGSLKLTMTAKAGKWPCALRDFPAQDWSQYTHLSFWVYVETDLATLPSETMGVILYTGKAQKGHPVSIAEKNKWVEVVVPLAPFGDKVDLKAVTRLKSTSSGGNRCADGAVMHAYIDDMALLVKEGAEAQSIPKPAAPKADAQWHSL